MTRVFQSTRPRGARLFLHKYPAVNTANPDFREPRHTRPHFASAVHLAQC